MCTDRSSNLIWNTKFICNYGVGTNLITHNIRYKTKRETFLWNFLNNITTDFTFEVKMFTSEKENRSWSSVCMACPPAQVGVVEEDKSVSALFWHIEQAKTLLEWRISSHILSWVLLWLSVSGLNDLFCKPFSVSVSSSSSQSPERSSETDRLELECSSVALSFFS